MKDNRLKQRLVGAAVLVALGVIFIPMLLSGPDPLDELVVRDTVPDRPEQRRRELVPLEDPPARPDMPSIEAVPVDKKVAEVEPLVDESLPPPRLGTRGRPASPEELEGEPRITEEEPEPEAEPEPEPEPEERAAAEADATHAWSVQVGSFSERGNAESLRQRLRDADFPAYVERTRRDDTTIYRVRVGPMASREAADELRHALHEQAGIRGMVMRHRAE